MLTMIASYARNLAAQECKAKDREAGRYHLNSIRPYDLDDYVQECALIRLESPSMPQSKVWTTARNRLRHPQGVVVQVVHAGMIAPQTLPASGAEFDLT